MMHQTRTLKRLLTLLLALAMLFALTACGKDKEEEVKIDYSGEWHATSFVIGGEEMMELLNMVGETVGLTMVGDKGTLLMGDEEPTEIVLQADGVCTFDGDAGTWSFANEQLTLSYVDGTNPEDSATFVFAKGAPEPVEVDPNAALSGLDGLTNLTGGEGSVNIQNDLDIDIFAAYISPSSSEDWGEDVLPTIIDAGTTDATMSGVVSGDAYDINLRELMDDEGSGYFFYNVTLNGGETLRFYWNANGDCALSVDGGKEIVGESYHSEASYGDGEEPLLIDFQNKLGYEVESVWISASDDDEWGDVLNIANIANEDSEMLLIYSIDPDGLYDISVQDVDGDVYDFYYVFVEDYGTLELHGPYDAAEIVSYDSSGTEIDRVAMSSDDAGEPVG